ncbi:MAG: hypothetical protein JWQ40_322 [Segetibacter sp.]|jgi:hypothetical protein|nr:hypothetical protein [Segetibacter sp.]
MYTFKLKHSWLLIIIAFLHINPAFSSPDDGRKKPATKWVVQKTSTLRIAGSSNVNTFGCDITGYYKPDTIICFDENAGNKSVALKGSLEIDVLKFDCHNRMLTSDLRKTLKADEYPTLVIRFLSLERLPAIKNEKDFLKGSVEILLGGSCRRFDISYTFEKSGSSLVLLNGNRSFSFSDFNLKPPRKLAGLVKVKDLFNVDFNLILDPVN